MSGHETQEITVFCGGNSAVGGPYKIKHDATKIFLSGSADITPSAGDLLRFKLLDPAADAVPIPGCFYQPSPVDMPEGASSFRTGRFPGTQGMRSKP